MKDLTIGTPRVVLWKLSLPMFVSSMFQQFYNIADSVIAGRFAGESALAAVGASHPVTMIFMAIAFGINIGCSVVISQLFGAKEYKTMKTAVSTTIIATIILSMVLTIIGVIICEPMLKLIKTPDDIFEQSALYLDIYIFGIAFLFLYNVTTGIFVAIGDSKTPLFFLIFSSLLNIFLDAYFVIKFQMGVSGVAWATFIAQGLACILALITLLLKIHKLKTEKYSKFSGAMIKKIGIIAIPSVLQQSFISVGNIFIQGIINGFGSSHIAGYSAASKISIFAVTSFITISNGISSFAAQNIGAKKFDRVKRGVLDGMVMSISISAVFFVAYFIFCPQLVSLFLESAEASQTAVETGSIFLRIAAPFYIPLAVKLVYDAVLRGAGIMKQFMVSTFADLLVRVILAFILAPHFGIIGVFASWPIGWIIALIVSFFYYKKGDWQKIHQAKE